MRAFLYYWPPSAADYENGELLNHSSSNQFKRVDVGDHVWHVTVRDGKLVILGRLVVGDILNQHDAAKKLSAKPDDLWVSDYHIIALNGIKPIREITIPRISDFLRFESKKDRLILRGGLVNPKQLRTMRELTPTSASDLQAKFDACKKF